MELVAEIKDLLYKMSEEVSDKNLQALLTVKDLLDIHIEEMKDSLNDTKWGFEDHEPEHNKEWDD